MTVVKCMDNKIAVYCNCCVEILLGRLTTKETKHQGNKYKSLYMIIQPARNDSQVTPLPILKQKDIWECSHRYIV